ncbi:hypothetical protein RRG08_023399 [Elysia crispata]|uniref:Uncharacterized protein n=1 Tax=Elysia crispata TaxID=231223 RepID=A0AAE0YDX4_9GAST|nr:hypothetical protein RRG08_023399 [Elysia crispata]
MLVRDDVALWAQASATVHRKTWYLKADVKLVVIYYDVQRAVNAVLASPSGQIDHLGMKAVRRHHASELAKVKYHYITGVRLRLPYLFVYRRFRGKV